MEKCTYRLTWTCCEAILGQMYEMKVKSQYHSASLKRVSTLDNIQEKANMYEQPKKTRVDEGKCEQEI